MINRGLSPITRIYFHGKEGKPDYQKTLFYLGEIERNNLPLANLLLGKMHRLGIGVDKNIELAKEYLNKAVNTGNVFALKEMGLLEISTGRYLKGSFLCVSALIKAMRIGASNPYDARLKNI